MKNLKILVTGTNSGLGKFICERMPDVTRLNRENRVDIVGSDRKYDIIIHSAYNSSNINFTDLDLKYVDDNLILTSELINLCGGCFIYVSSIDSINKIESSYALFKKLSEDLIRSKIENYFIIRPSHLIQYGESDKIPNSLRKIINDESITLTENSKFNLVSYEDILSYIVKKIKNEIEDREINLVNSESIMVSDVIEMLEKNNGCGDFEYIPTIPKESYKVENSSKEMLMKYLKEINHGS
jgi:nucleoside-diphosphate-sugar epimerase|tara:strand:- start:319 stop:1041 length:723 start_codon:yes stop_codon:yes gene_type:complete